MAHREWNRSKSVKMASNKLLYVLSLLLLLVLAAQVRARDVSTVHTGTSVTSSVSLVETSSITDLEAISEPPILPKALTLCYTDATEANKTSTLLQHICRHSIEDRQTVETVLVIGSRTRANWTEIEAGLTCLPNLEDLHWRMAGLMPGMKQFLEDTLADCRLHLDLRNGFDYYSRKKVSDNAFLALLGSKNLYSVKAEKIYHSEPEPHWLPDLHRLITSCPGVRSLHLGLSHEGCIVSGGQPRAFDFADPQMFNLPMPVLNELRLSGYALEWDTSGNWRRSEGYGYNERLLSPLNHLSEDAILWYMPENMQSTLSHWREWMFDATNSTNSFKKWMSSAYMQVSGDHRLSGETPCDAPCCSKRDDGETNLQAWMNNTAFTNVTTLSLDRLDYTTARLLLPELHSLQDLSIYYTDGCSAHLLTQWLKDSARHLQSLQLRYIHSPSNNHSNLVHALATNKQSLRSLQLGFVADERQYLPQHIALTNSHLEDLVVDMVHLTHLDIDVDRNAPPEDMAETFRILRKLPALQTLTLRAMTPGSTRRYPLAEDKVFNASMLTKLTRSLILPQPNEKVTMDDPPSLRSLELIVGPWASRNVDGMMGPPEELIGRYVCTVQSSLPESTANMTESSGVSATRREEVNRQAAPLPDEYEDGLRVSCSGGFLDANWHASLGGTVKKHEGPDWKTVLDQWHGIVDEDEYDMGNAALLDELREAAAFAAGEVYTPRFN